MPYTEINNKAEAEARKIVFDYIDGTSGGSTSFITENGIYGTLTGNYTEGTASVSSSIIAGYSFDVKYCYDTGLQMMPVLILIHGWSGTINDFTQAMMQRFASYKYFVLALNMRTLAGTASASGKRLYNVYDAVNYISENHSVANTLQLAVSGYSGGGGNVLGLCCKFPDMFSVSCSYFGMADYGYTTDGWYYTDFPLVANTIGCVPTACYERYFARYATYAINNYMGYLFLYHSPNDGSVDVVNSRNINSAFTGRHYYDENVLMTHGYPTAGYIVETENDWNEAGLYQMRNIVPSIGSFRVIGYIHTKRFKIVLNDYDMDAVVDLTYNTTSRRYTLTPKTSGNIDVDITQGEYSVSDTINTKTTLMLLVMFSIRNSYESDKNNPHQNQF